jgi:hypothetical protein
MATEAKYAFVVKGKTPDGTKAKMEGFVWDEDNFPSSAFDKAVACCKELAPGLIVDMSVGGNVVLSKRKTKK